MHTWANNMLTTLSAGITASANSMTVASVGDLTLGAGETAFLTLQDETASLYEIVKVTAISGLVLTIERAQEGTTAAVWAAGAVAVGGVPTKSQLKSFEVKPTWFNTAIPSINTANGQLQELTLAANGTLSISMSNNEAMTLLIKPSSFTLAMPTIKWFGKAFVLVANKEHLLTIFKKDDVLRGTWSREV